MDVCMCPGFGWGSATVGHALFHEIQTPECVQKVTLEELGW